MRVICDSLGLQAEDYTSEEAVTSSEELYNGFVIQPVDDQVIDRYYTGEDVFIDQEDIQEPWYPNQYVMLVSNEKALHG